MHYYQHNIKSFNNATRHLTRVERSLYRDLIELYYDTEQPLKVSEFDRLARRVMAFSEEEKAALHYVLDEFFELNGDYWTNDKCEEEIAKYQEAQSAKSRAGKASAEARKAALDARKQALKQHNLTGVDQSLNSVQQTSNHKPITNNHKPDEKQSADCQKNPDRRKETLDAKDLVNLGVDEQVARDWLAVRKKKKMPLTETALKKMQTEAAKVGITLVDAINICAEQPWGGFKSEYYQNMRVSSHEGQQATDRERQLSRSASGRVTLNAERELAEIARQRNDSSLVGDDVPALRPPVDDQFR